MCLAADCGGVIEPTPGGNARASLKDGRRLHDPEILEEPTPGGNARASLKESGPAVGVDLVRLPDPGRKRPGLIEGVLSYRVTTAAATRPRAETPGPH